MKISHRILTAGAVGLVAVLGVSLPAHATTTVDDHATENTATADQSVPEAADEPICEARIETSDIEYGETSTRGVATCSHLPPGYSFRVVAKIDSNPDFYGPWIEQTGTASTTAWFDADYKNKTAAVEIGGASTGSRCSASLSEWDLPLARNKFKVDVNCGTLLPHVKVRGVLDLEGQLDTHTGWITASDSSASSDWTTPISLTNPTVRLEWALR